ncbi:hypothetical protein HXX76_002021 [Chlamydomonas incerta]|uniref:Uncharacterized protein n=1 Tax=Chlamydomonas incerta TaxID=51695 RepID=A0A835WAA0_CHLIN|nr:hypothetical protein HXX76_002021 [Chlamydomonas incerta]|eukprot:KAG2443673.1 hypothetical protein HXX76_002021 [Chlamydomonas incerta]
MAAPAKYLDEFQLSAVIKHGGADTADDVTADLAADVVVASHKAQALKALDKDVIPSVAVDQLARNAQLVASRGDAAAVTRGDLSNFKAELLADLKVGFLADLKVELLAAMAEQAAASNRNLVARMQNSQAFADTPYTVLVREKATAGAAALGAEPAGFPVNNDSLFTLTTSAINQLAQHYGEEFAGNGVVERRKAVARFIGVRW